MQKSFVRCLLLTLLSGSASHAAIIQFDLQGKGGSGLLGSNEWSNGLQTSLAGTPGSGSETGPGFSFNDVTKVLTLNFAWTNLQGASAGTFGAANGFHIHGPVTQSDSQAFTAGVLHNISANAAGGGATPSYTIVNNINGTGSVTGTISNIPFAQEADLLAGKWYVNVHSSLNSGGEIRGNLVVVPEPATATMAALGLIAIMGRRRRA